GGRQGGAWTVERGGAWRGGARQVRQVAQQNRNVQEFPHFFLRWTASTQACTRLGECCTRFQRAHGGKEYCMLLTMHRHHLLGPSSSGPQSLRISVRRRAFRRVSRI